MILVIDNYDSFTFSLVHLLRQEGEEVQVCRCDRVTTEDVLRRRPRRIVISPGPGRPEDRGIAVELVRRAAGVIPLLGVCLGHQAIGMAFGAEVVPAPHPVHGTATAVYHRGTGLFRGLPSPLQAMRYHSLVLRRSTLPPALEVTAWLPDEEGTVMGVRHRRFDLQGIQFHPESFLSPGGPELIHAFLAGVVEARQ